MTRPVLALVLCLGLEKSIHVRGVLRVTRKLLDPKRSQAQAQNAFMMIEGAIGGSRWSARTYDERGNVSSTFDIGSFRIVPQIRFWTILTCLIEDDDQQATTLEAIRFN